MKIKDIAGITTNKLNNQVSLNLRSKKMKMLGMTPEQLMDMVLLKPKQKYNQKGVRNK